MASRRRQKKDNEENIDRYVGQYDQPGFLIKWVSNEIGNYIFPIS